MSAPKWVTLPQYMDMTGISRETFYILYEQGIVTAIKTDGGQWRIMIEESAEINELREEITTLNTKIDLLCSHLGVRV